MSATHVRLARSTPRLAGRTLMRIGRGGIVRKHDAQTAISADEQLWRYAYVLGNGPASIADLEID
ncbi:hypothetical protein GCM10023087_14690 [Microbacterium rhizosphaerae]